MGPRSNERGNGLEPDAPEANRMLQWGHVQMNVEI